MSDDAITKNIRGLGDLTPDQHNPRTHTARNIGMIAESLQKFGANRGIVVDENGTVLAGNGVLEAALQAGIEHVKVVPVNGDEIVAIQVTHLTDEQKRQYAVADNRTAELAQWNTAELSAMMQEGISLDSFWFADELERMMQAPPPAFAPSLAPTTSERPVTATDMQREADRIDGKYDGTKKQHESILCPHCGEEFFLEK